MLTSPDSEVANQIMTGKDRDEAFPYTPEVYADRLGRAEGYGRYDMPFLKIHFPSGQIFGHEGRHRSALVLRHGGTRIPVTIYPYVDNAYQGTITYFDATDEKITKTVGPFVSYAEYTSVMAGEKAKVEADEENYYVKSKDETLHGGTLKGAPARSEGWDKAAWTVEDFPHQLVGQYDDSIHVTDYRVGLVKGYNHHTR